ncbi:ATP-binding protein [Anaerolineales bacterium HSG25]|nr:ATP-binding protein [Anaerolineales bacterium HSG25]
MSIGTSLDLQAMLKHSLQTILRKLNCSAGGIYRLQKDKNGMVYEKIYTIPRSIRHNKTYKAALQQIHILANDQHFQQQLPLIQSNGNSNFHILELHDFGLMILIKNGKPLNPYMIKSLNPIQAKLASSCNACIQNEELSKKTIELKESSNTLLQVMEDMKRTQEKVEYLATKNQVILNAIPDLMFYIDSAGYLLDYKITAENDLPVNISSEAMQGKHIKEMLPPPLVEQILKHAKKALDTKNIQLYEYSMPVQRGVEFFEARFVASGDNEVLAIVRNITTRKQNEEQIEVLARFPAENPDPILRVAQDGTLLYANEASQLVLDNWSCEVGQSVPTDWYHLVVETLQLAHNQTFEIQINEQVYSFILTPIHELNYVNLYGRDVTERYELDRLRDEFIATVSHELRTPLASIMGYTEIILAGRPGPLTDVQRRFLENSYSGSKRLLKLIEEILTVSHIQQGTLTLDKKQFIPTQAIETVQEMVVSLATNRSISLEIKNDWPDHVQILGDSRRLEQVLINLIGNAVKFTPEGGNVTIHSYQANQSWCVEIVDTGIGIPEEDISKLFQRFHRGSNVASEQIQGTGLGLYVCKAIIEGHDGQIGLESQSGQGTRVWFHVPLIDTHSHK